jgi:acyl-CoA synthetase (AMP-forming)/AMP-acid ligase II
VIISDILAWSARQWPDRECIVEVDPAQNTRRSLTYRQFDQRANRVANALLDAGIKKGDMVLHFMRNRIEWLESYFGIIRIGAIVVPLNFRFTGSDVKYAADVVKPSLVVIEDELTGIIAPVRSSLNTVRNYICVGEDTPDGMKAYEDFISDHPATRPDVNVSEDDDLGVYFTSGTTGIPKPILFTQKNLSAVAVSNALTIPLPPDANSVIYCPLYHTGTFFFWLPYLFQGGKCTLLQRFSPDDLLKTFEQEKGTEVNIPMPHCVDLLTAQQTGKINVTDYDLSSWSLINTGAQPYPPSLLRDMVNLFPNVGIQHGFGISEGGGAALTMLPPDEILKKPGSAGKAVVMVDVRVIDSDGQDVNTGEPGELAVRTERMMKEYYRNSEATAEAIRDGWLYTGDIARQDEDGYIYIVDRKKDVIISGGENVYPGELENVLMTHPKIMEVAVIGTPDERWGERVTAIVNLKPGDEMTGEELLEWCRGKFPAYKRPRRIEFGDLPKSPTNKILKPELRARYGGTETAFRGAAENNGSTSN